MASLSFDSEAGEVYFQISSYYGSQKQDAAFRFYQNLFFGYYIAASVQ